MKRLNSLVSGALSGAQSPADRAGAQHGEPASGSRPTGSALTAVSRPPAVHDPKASAWLASLDPRTVDARAQSRMLTYGVALSVNTRSTWDENDQFKSQATSVTITPVKPSTAFSESSEAERCAAAAAEIERFMSPASEDQIEQWLVELSVSTVRRAGSEGEAEIALSVYAGRLAQYPADVVRTVLREASKRSKWWPAWADLEPELDRLAKPRILMREALLTPPEQREQLTHEREVPDFERRKHLAMRELEPWLEEARAKVRADGSPLIRRSSDLEDESHV